MTSPQQQPNYLLVTKQELELFNALNDIGIDNHIEFLIDRQPYRSRPAPSPSPCEENGCTDIDNCDEICEHSRIYSPIQMEEAKKQAAAQAREDVLDELIELRKRLSKKYTIPTAWEIEGGRIQSLRTKEHP